MVGAIQYESGRDKATEARYPYKAADATCPKVGITSDKSVGDFLCGDSSQCPLPFRLTNPLSGATRLASSCLDAASRLNMEFSPQDEDLRRDGEALVISRSGPPPMCAVS